MAYDDELDLNEDTEEEDDLDGSLVDEDGEPLEDEDEDDLEKHGFHDPDEQDDLL